VLSVAFSPDGRRLLSGSDDGTLRLWDAESGQEIHAFAGHQDWVWSVAFSPDGRRLLSGGRDQTLRLWDAESGQEIRAFAPAIRVGCRASPFRPTAAACSPAAGDRTLRLWDAESGQEIRVFAGHQGGEERRLFARRPPPALR
jgi:WD40 repeat protein